MITLSCYVAWEILYIWHGNTSPEIEYTSLEVEGLTSPVCDTLCYILYCVSDTELTAQSVEQHCAVYYSSKINFV